MTYPANLASVIPSEPSAFIRCERLRPYGSQTRREGSAPCDARVTCCRSLSAENATRDDILRTLAIVIPREAPAFSCADRGIC